MSKIIEKLIKSNMYLSNEEKLRYGIIKNDSNEKLNEDKCLELLKRYKDVCKSIYKVKEGMIVYVSGKALYFNSEGILKSEINNSITPVSPLGQIIYSNMKYIINKLQLKKIKQLRIKEYIVRNGDTNAYFEDDNKLSWITKNGQVLSSEKWTIEDIKMSTYEIIEAEEYLFTEGEHVKVHGSEGVRYGKVYRIYNEGNTLSIYFSKTNSVGAFYKGNVEPDDREEGRKNE